VAGLALSFRNVTSKATLRGLEVRKRISAYPSILRHQHSKLLRINLLWATEKRDFYPMARECP
jgi:hypothetical protein